MESGDRDGYGGSNVTSMMAFWKGLKILTLLIAIVELVQYYLFQEVKIIQIENSRDALLGPPICNYFKWHDEWKSERCLALLNEIRTLKLHLHTLGHNKVNDNNTIHRAMKKTEALRKQICF
ncbi:conserved hypothetical protein [Ricinus communis]|uniref:Uncharacterized protein n=1 Tax=Ricinus communis TaxID=3988 RepID=B9SRE7_RICCO|nr:conserved hypothetical protein [Ricinus communis]